MNSPERNEPPIPPLELNPNDPILSGEQNLTVSENERIATERRQAIEQWTQLFTDALAKTDDPTNPEYYDPQVELVNPANPNEKLNEAGFNRLLDEYTTVVIGPLKAGTPAERERAIREENFINDLKNGVGKELEKRTDAIKKSQLEADKNAFYAEPANKSLAELRNLLETPEFSTATNDLSLKQELITLFTGVQAGEKVKENVKPEIQQDIDKLIVKAKERQVRVSNELSKRYQSLDRLKTIGDDVLRGLTTSLVETLNQDATALLNQGDNKITEAIEDTRYQLKDFFPETFDRLMTALEVTALDSDGEQVVLFPTDSQKNNLERFLRQKTSDILTKLENAHQNKLEAGVDVVVDEIAKIQMVESNGSSKLVDKTNDRLITYTYVLTLREKLKHVSVSENYKKLQDKLSWGKKRIEELVREFEVEHTEWLSDSELLKLVIDRKVSPYDYSNWRLTNINDDKLHIRSEWGRRTESRPDNEPFADARRARLKIRYVMAEYSARLVEGKQLPEIDEDQVPGSLKMALATRIDVIKGIEIAPDGNSDKRKKIRDMIAFIAKNAALRDTDPAGNPNLTYATLSNIQGGAQEALALELRNAFPDSEGYTQENRDLAMNAAILFKYLTAALVELMSETMTGAHKYEKNADALLIENIFKYAIHVILRYEHSEHAWSELLAFLKEVPEDFGPSDAKIKKAIHFAHLIRDFNACFGDISDIYEQIQTPGFMIPLFPNMLQLAGLRPHETIVEDEKVFGYGRVHFANMVEYLTKPDGTEIPIKQKADEQDFDYAYDSASSVPALKLENLETQEIVGRKRLSRVMNGNREVKGKFLKEVTEGDFSVRGVFFLPDGQTEALRVIPILRADGSLEAHYVGKFELVDKVSNDGVPYKAWQKIDGAHYFTVEDLQKPKYFRSDGTEIVGAFTQTDQNGTWLYAPNKATGVIEVVGAFSKGKIWQINDARRRVRLATELGYQVNAYTDNDGKEVYIKKEYSTVETGQKLGGEGSKIEIKRKLVYKPTFKNIWGADVVFRKLDACVAIGKAPDPLIEFGTKEERESRKEDPHAVKLSEYQKVGYVDISQVYAISADGSEELGEINESGRVINTVTKAVIGTVTNENVIIGNDGEVLGFATYGVRSNDAGQPVIGYVFPEFYQNDKIVSGIPTRLRVAGLDDNRDIYLDGAVTSYEQMEVARGAYQRMWEMLLQEFPPIEHEDLLKGKNGGLSVFHKYFADLLGKIKMMDGPHMAMYTPLSKYVIFNWMQKIVIHYPDEVRSPEERRDWKLSVMRGLWVEMYLKLEQMLYDTGLSGSYREMIQDLMVWMVDKNNLAPGQKGMNPIFTGLYWETDEGEQARINYIDALFAHDAGIRNPHKRDKLTNRQPGFGEGFGFKGGSLNLSAFANINAARVNAKRVKDVALVQAIDKWLNLFGISKNDISKLERPIAKKGAGDVKAEIDKDNKK
jgi:hypothetical protein